jgi:VWFA-related protein
MPPRLISLIPVSALIVCTALLGAQEPQPTPIFRARVDVIEVELRVVDQEGHPILDLDRSEVEVLEDGRPQDIVGFTRVSVPTGETSEADRAPISTPPDVASNRAAAESRIYVLLLDDLHIDGRHAGELKQVARSFVDRHMGPGDLAAVVYASGRADAAQDFTSDPALLRAAIDKFGGRKLRAASVERMEQYNLLYRGWGAPRFEDLRDRQDGERAFNASSALQTIETVSTVLSRVRGRRKAMILFSEGIDYDLSGLRSRGQVSQPQLVGRSVLSPTSPSDGFEDGAAGRLDVHSYGKDVLVSLQAALGAASRANVTLYPIDVRRGDVSDSVMEMGAPVQDTGLGLSPQAVFNEMRDAQTNLWMLAENTGGFATLTSSDYDSVFSRIVEESSEYYVLAYSPQHTVLDGGYRAISVRVNRPGVRVSARRGYYERRNPSRPLARMVASGVAQETSELLMTPLPSAGLTLDLNAVALRGEGKTADVIVTVQLEGREVAPEDAGAQAVNTLELALMALDSAGAVHAATGTAFDIRLDDEATRIMREAGYRVISRVRVPPGRYQIRAAVRERRGGRHGSVFGYVDVPDFSRRPAVSGVLLSSAGGDLVPTSVDPATYSRLPSLPAVRRAFPAGEQLWATLELYGPPPRRGLEVTTRVLDRAGQEIYRSVARVTREHLREEDGVYVHEVHIPLEAPSSDLLLVIEASSGGRAVTRRIPFSVAPGPADTMSAIR